MSKFKITSADGNTLVAISEKGIMPRGLRADMKMFDESLLTNDFIQKVGEYTKGVGDSIKSISIKLEQQEKQSKIDKLEEMCSPISDYLKENYCPYDSVVITDDKIRLVRDEIDIPVDRENEDAKTFSEAIKEIENEMYSALGLNKYQF